MLKTNDLLYNSLAEKGLIDVNIYNNTNVKLYIDNHEVLEYLLNMKYVNKLLVLSEILTSNYFSTIEIDDDYYIERKAIIELLHSMEVPNDVLDDITNRNKFPTIKIPENNISVDSMYFDLYDETLVEKRRNSQPIERYYRYLAGTKHDTYIETYIVSYETGQCVDFIFTQGLVDHPHISIYEARNCVFYILKSQGIKPMHIVSYTVPQRLFDNELYKYERRFGGDERDIWYHDEYDTELNYLRREKKSTKYIEKDKLLHYLDSTGEPKFIVDNINDETIFPVKIINE